MSADAPPGVPTPVRAHTRRKRQLILPVVEEASAPVKRRRRAYTAPPAPVSVAVVWKSGKTERYEAQRYSLAPEVLLLQSMTPDYRLRTVLLARSEFRHVVIEEPIQMPAAPSLPAFPMGTEATPPPGSPAGSVMHVSPGMARRAGERGRTVVTPDGRTVTETPEGDILGAALFAAGLPPGKVGL